MNARQKQLRTEIVMKLMLSGTVTPREFASRNGLKYGVVAHEFSTLKKGSVVEASRLAKRKGGTPVVLMPKAMASVMEHVKTSSSREEAVGAMLEGFFTNK